MTAKKLFAGVGGLVATFVSLFGVKKWKQWRKSTECYNQEAQDIVQEKYDEGYDEEQYNS